MTTNSLQPSSDVSSASCLDPLFRAIISFFMIIPGFLLRDQLDHTLGPFSFSAVISFPVISDWMFFMQASPFSGRGFELYMYYKELDLPPGLIFNYTFIGLCEKNTTDPPNLAMPDNYLNWQSHPRKDALWTFRSTAGMFWTFKYVIAETKARWIFFGDDDILINFDLLLPFMRELHRKHDPLKDVVVRGDCINSGLSYPQGGSGVVLSRRAVEDLAPLGNHSIWDFWEECPDMRLGHVMYELWSNTGRHASTAFLGQPFGALDFDKVRNKNFTELPSCPQSSGAKNESCPSWAVPAHQLVFFHTGRVMENGPGMLTKRLEIAQILWKAPPDIGVWVDGGYSRSLCRKHEHNLTVLW
jgi:hypothetical protein